MPDLVAQFAHMRYTENPMPKLCIISEIQPKISIYGDKTYFIKYSVYQINLSLILLKKCNIV